MTPGGTRGRGHSSSQMFIILDITRIVLLSTFIFIVT